MRNALAWLLTTVFIFSAVLTALTGIPALRKLLPKRFRPARKFVVILAVAAVGCGLLAALAHKAEQPASPVPAGVDRAQFLSETIPDGSVFSPGEYFEKTWVLRNSGTSAWEGHRWVFVGGNQMRAPDSIEVPRVEPDGTWEAKVKFRAPMEAGEYRSEWQMQNRSGMPFPDKCYVMIRVVAADAATFVTDVSIPDDTVIERGKAFSKTWRFKNTGRTTWTKSYSLRFDGGDQLAAPSLVQMPKDVLPNEVCDIRVDMTAPLRPETYQGYWRLTSPLRRPFGPRVYVRIIVR